MSRPDAQARDISRLVKAAQRIARGCHDREKAAKMAREWHGSGRSVFISHAAIRDLHDALAPFAPPRDEQPGEGE